MNAGVPFLRKNAKFVSAQKFTLAIMKFIYFQASNMEISLGTISY